MISCDPFSTQPTSFLNRQIAAKAYYYILWTSIFNVFIMLYFRFGSVRSLALSLSLLWFSRCLFICAFGLCFSIPGASAISILFFHSTESNINNKYDNQSNDGDGITKSRRQSHKHASKHNRLKQFYKNFYHGKASRSLNSLLFYFIFLHQFWFRIHFSADN